MKKRGDEQKTWKRIGEHRHMRTGGKRRAGKSERVQLPTGNGKQTKRGERGKEIREQVGKEERERMKEKRGEGAE